MNEERFSTTIGRPDDAEPTAALRGAEAFLLVAGLELGLP